MRLNWAYGMGILALVLGGCASTGGQEVKSASSAPSASEPEVVVSESSEGNEVSATPVDVGDNVVNPDAVYSVSDRKVVSDGSSKAAELPRPNRLAVVSAQESEVSDDVQTGAKCETDADCLGQDKCLKGESGEGHCVRQ